MSLRNSIGNLVSEKVFYRACVILLGGLPIVEIITEIIGRFNNIILPSFFLPQMTGIFGVFGTLITILYWLSMERGKRKLRISDIFYFTLLFFMILSAVCSRNPGVYSEGDYFYCENPLHFLAYYWLYFAGTLIDDPKYRKNLLYLFAGVAVLEGIFAFLQTFNIELSYSLYYYTEHTAYGLTQNSNYYGGLCVVLIAGISGMYFFSDFVTDSKYMKYVLPAVLAFLFYTMSSQILPTRRNNKRYADRVWQEAVAESRELNTQCPGYKVPDEYAHPATYDRMIRVIREGKAKTADEAWKVMTEELMAINSSVTVSQTEYDEITAIKPMFLIVRQESGSLIMDDYRS